MLNAVTAPAIPKLLLTTSEAAKALSVSERTLYAIAVNRAEIPRVILPGGAVRYSVADLNAWIEKKRGKR